MQDWRKTAALRKPAGAHEIHACDVPLLSSARNIRRLIAEAVDAVGAGVPTGRAVVERPAVAEGAAMSTRAAALRNLDDHRVIGRIDCRQRHGLRASCEECEARGKNN